MPIISALTMHRHGTGHETYRREAHSFDEIPEAELEGDAVPLDRPDQAAQQLGIVAVPCPLLQAALHCHPHHLPLGLSLYVCSFHVQVCGQPEYC